MTEKEYEAGMSVLTGLLKKEGFSEERFNEIGAFQQKYMRSVVNEYAKTVGDDKAKDIILEILLYETEDSLSGSAIINIPDEETAKRVNEILFEEIGTYLLDGDIYQEESGQWVADVMFGGDYVPYWDGFKESWWYEEVSA
jgi:hypothetical protein